MPCSLVLLLTVQADGCLNPRSRIASVRTGGTGMQTELECPAGFSTVYRAGQRRARVATLLLGSVAFVTFLLLMHEIAGLGIIEEARAGTLTQASARGCGEPGACLGVGYALAYLVAAAGYLARLTRDVGTVA